MLKHNESMRNNIETAFAVWNKVGGEKFIEQLIKQVGKNFRHSRSFWVRPSPNHKLSKCDSKVIAISVENSIKLGGWHQKGACTFLHNFGYIIVDKNGEPVTENETKSKKIPDELPYLVKGKNRIILVAKIYKIDPARKKEQLTVKICDNELANDIGPSVKRSEVSKVLSNLDFQNQMGVELKCNPEINDEGAKIFTFNLQPPLYFNETEKTEIGVKGELEGNLVEKIINVHERSAKNRREALKIHGYKCFACGFKMEELYGKTAEKIIDIHHLIPLSELVGKTEVNYKDDLVPLCPNCHRVVHVQKNNLLTPDEVGELFNKYGYKKIKSS